MTLNNKVFLIKLESIHSLLFETQKDAKFSIIRALFCHLKNTVN